jgi:signal transduction histidine kinase/ActR/RegA family two-component response regulator
MSTGTSFFDKLARQPSGVARYALPFWTILVALLIQGALQATVDKGQNFPYALFYLVAIFVTAWIGGYIPGVIGTLITTVGIPTLTTGAFHFTSAEVSRVGLVVAVSLVISKVANVQRSSKAALRVANQELDQRVQERTLDLSRAITALETEVAQRRQTESKLQIQLERLNLLDQITRAIGERQDLQSVFQVAVRSLEEHLPVDFCCICLHNSATHEVRVTCVGVNSEALAMDLAMGEQASIPIDENGLSRCVQGHLVYEPDIAEVKFPFPQRLARGGLGSLVIAPVLVESQVFGVLITARREKDGFSSTDCEFLRQLSEHVALAAHQAQVHAALQQAYDDLRQSQQTAMQQERLRALGQMASGIAHDINNAISPVSLYTEMILATEPNLSPRVYEYLKTTGRAIEDVAHTVSRMREFYRKQEPALLLAPVNVNTLVQQVLDFTRVRWSDIPQKRGLFIDLRMELMRDPPTVAGIESEIREALINLIFNAVDAMPEGGTMSIRTRLSMSLGNKAYLDVEVTDTGVGMSEETRKRCLEPFFTTKGERGTGLGLAMVYGVAQRHDADVELESELGQGTTVRLRFPVSTMDTENLLALNKATSIPTRLRLLVVDDDPLLTRCLRETLEIDGHIVAVAQGGQEGITAFQASLERGEPFAMVLTDLGMPHVDGRKLAKAVKTASPTTPVLLLTGWGQRLIAEGDVPAHVDRVLNKPPKIGELRTALSELSKGLAS